MYLIGKVWLNVCSQADDGKPSAGDCRGGFSAEDIYIYMYMYMVPPLPMKTVDFFFFFWGGGAPLYLYLYQ